MRLLTLSAFPTSEILIQFSMKNARNIFVVGGGGIHQIV